MYLSSYVHAVLIELAESEINTDNLDSEEHEYQFVTVDLTFKWEEIAKILGRFPDEFNVLQQPPEWYKEIIKKLWKIIHDAGKALISSTLKQRIELWKLCENFTPIVHLDKCYNKLTSDRFDSKLYVLLVLTSSLERFLGNVYLTKGQNVPFLLRDLLATKELFSVFGSIPIIFTQLLIGCPLGLNIRNVAWHGFLSPNEINTNLIASLFILFGSLNIIVRKLLQNVPVRAPVKLNFHCELLGGVFPDLAIHLSDVNTILDCAPFIPKSHKGYWREAYRSYKMARHDECLIVILPQLEHLLRIIYCNVNDCPNRLLTAEATDLYTTLDEILAPTSEGGSNHMIEILGHNLLEAIEDILSYPEGPRIRDKISHGEFSWIDEDELDVTKVFSNHVYCIGLCVIYVASQKLNINTCNESIQQKFKENQHETHCECSKQKEVLKKLNFLELSLLKYRSKFHLVAYLLRSVHNELDKVMLWNQLPRPCDSPYGNGSGNSSYETLPNLKSLIFCHIFKNTFVDANDFFDKLRNYLENIDCLTLHRPRNEGIIVTLMRQIMTKIGNFNLIIKNASITKWKQWNEHKMRSRARLVYQTMLQFLPTLQIVFMCLISIILYETKFLNQLSTDWQNIMRFLKYSIKYIENITSYCNTDKNQWQEVIKLTSEFTVCALDYLNVFRFKNNCTHSINCL